MTDATATDTQSSGNEDRKFDGALNSVLHTDKKDYPCYVGGLKIASGNDCVVTSPVDESIIFGRFQEPEDGLADRAVDIALKAFGTWSRTTAAERTDIFEKICEAVVKQRYRIAAAITLSAGMTRTESLYEADRLIKIIDDNVKKMKDGAKGRPYGVWAVISEYNSPLAAPIGYAVSAMLAGNTAIVIPPKECPFPVYMLYDIISPMLPDGVLGVIYDRKGKTAKALAENEDVKGIAAAGRSDRFEDLMFSAAGDELAMISEFKGMNPLIVYKPASMQAAADIAVSSAFRYSGQRMDSCSKVIITAPEQKSFIDQLLAAAKKITVGDPAEKGTFTGPVISKDSMERFLKIVKDAKENLIFGGKRITDETTEAGYYVMPAIFAGLSEDHELNGIDHSLPILSVQIVDGIDEAVYAANSCETGLGSGIISKDERIIEQFLHDACTDVVYVNGPSSIVGTAIRADVNEFLKK